MRRLIFAALLSVCVPALAAPTPENELMVPPKDARHYTISSTASKSGDIWSWKTADGKTAYRMSLNLRGWRTETDALYTFGTDGKPVKLAVRGFTDSGDAAEDYSVDDKGIARWKTTVDEGSAPIAGKTYAAYGGPVPAVAK